jgi:5-methylcytosine-specific restriction enzyme subunit McrC
MLAYCAALNLTVGHLVYAKGNEAETSAVIRNAGTAIHCHTVDLDANPEALLTQVGGVATSIASQATSHRRVLAQAT